MMLIKLTAPDGKPVWINPEMVCTVGTAVDNNYAYSKTAIHHASGTQYVCELPETVAQYLTKLTEATKGN